MPPKKSEIEINGKQYIVEAKELTFFDVQAVAPVLASGSLDFSDYWRYAFARWPDFYGDDERPDTNSVSPEVGQQLASMLPEPSKVMEWLVFREAKSAASNTSFTGGAWSTDFATNEKGWSTF
tara:strand:- start:880 stop:1248 length:369 start_codon:yes stop_codon:yes gene_type:complete